MPVLAGGAALVDLARAVAFRRPWMALRLLAFGWVFLAVEVVGLLWFLAGWIASGFGRQRERLVAAAWPTQRWWARTLFAAAQRIFAITLEIEGAETARPGPIIAMFRHASIVDNLLPAVLLTDGEDMRLRWVIKKELLAVPALDVGGTRLPNHFVERASTDPRDEIRKIRALAKGLEEDEGVLIYPEGTRFTEPRRERAVAGLASRPALQERARRFRHVLPPRIGGPLALLDTGYDVVFCAHSGLDGFATIGDVWSGGIVGAKVRAEMWRVPAGSIPKTRTERISWLFDQWDHVDGWVGAATERADRLTPPRASRPPTPSSP